jgi:AbiV family abortive infection protein
MKTEKNKRNNEDPNEILKRLSDKNLGALRTSCFENASSLIKESELLLNNSFYSRSFFLSYSALEELGKYLVVCDYMTGIVSKTEFETAFRDHTMKIAYAHNYVNLKKTENGTYDATLIYDINKFEDWKIFRNNSLYIGLKENYIGIVPKIEITKEIAEKIFARVTKERKDIIIYENMNERIGSEAFYK